MNSYDRLKHFFFRAGFGIGPYEIRLYDSQSLDEIITNQLTAVYQSNSVPTDLVSDYQKLDSREDNTMFLKNYDQEAKAMAVIRHQWITAMALNSEHILLEKMTLFWHHHFACQCQLATIAKNYKQILYANALGNYRQLLKEISKTPAMLLFLNNQQNRKDRPNENFARELMELFTLGVGHYSEKDVKEAARAFTGWSSDDQFNFVFRPQIHDQGNKEFLGNRGPFDGDDIIDLILAQPQAARFLATKAYQFFVHEKVDSDAINLLAKTLLDHDYEIKPFLRTLFTSDFFYQREVIGNRIKSPVELIVSTMRLLHLRFEDSESLSYLQLALGQQLFNPPNVSGWTGGESWINNATMMIRLNFGGYLLEGERFDHVTTAPLEAMQTDNSIQKIDVNFDLEPILELFGGIPYEELEATMKKTLLAYETSTVISKKREMRQYNYSKNLILRIISLPEFQLS